MADKPLPAAKNIALSADGDIVVVATRKNSFAHAESAEFNTIWNELSSTGCRRFVFDLSSCRFVSSEALGMMAACWKWCGEESNGRMSVVLPVGEGGEVRNLFEITGLSRTIGAALQSSLQDALNYLREFS